MGGFFLADRNFYTGICLTFGKKYAIISSRSRSFDTNLREEGVETTEKWIQTSESYKS
nr:MAG TPA: hypothetical protein [Bacteriophage sp.]